MREGSNFSECLDSWVGRGRRRVLGPSEMRGEESERAETRRDEQIEKFLRSVGISDRLCLTR